jgi:hypothetical protein
MNLPYEATFTLQCVANLKTMPFNTEIPSGGYFSPYLWARREDHAIGLAQSTGDSKTGTRWYATHRADGTVWLWVPDTQELFAPHLYLQRGAGGVIGVTPDQSLPGTAWKVVEAPNNLALQCVMEGTEVELLYGELATGLVGTQSTQYAPHHGVEQTGRSTEWLVDNKQYTEH